MRDGGFQFGDWRVNPSSNSIINGQERRSMEPRAMDVLRALCQEPGTVVSSEHLLDTCWGGAELGDNPVHKTIAQLRRILGDTAAAPRYIETIRKRGYRTVAQVDYPEDQSVAPPPWLNSSPFRGLQAFFEDHAAIFFGRRDASARLCNAVCARMDSGMALQLVLGPSGSGKTSLIRAGLLPMLQQPALDAIAPRLCSAIVLDAGEIGEHSLFVALASALLDWEPSDALVFPGESADSLAHRLQDDLFGVIEQINAAVAQAQLAPARLGIFIDRLEALFTLPQLDEAERQRFLDLLGGLARSNCVLVIAACRNDFYPRIAEYPMLMAAKELGGHFDLAAPSPTEIGQIIRMPALAAGLQFGTDPDTGRTLDDVLCEGAATTADALPLLQYTLQELYRLRSADNTLGFAAFQSLGGVEGAIGHRAEEVVAGLDAAQRDALTRVLSLIVTVSPGDDAVTGRRAPWSALTDPAERAVVTTLVDTRLLVSELVGAEPGFGVAHEALLRRWPRVTEWIDAHRNALRIRARIAQVTTRWSSENRPVDLLLPPGKQLDEARSLLGISAFSLTGDEIDLIQASTRRARSRERLRFASLGMIMLLALLSVVLGLSAVASKRTAQQRRLQAEDLMETMLGDFADKLRPLGRLELLESVTNKAMQYLTASTNEDESIKTLTQRAKALQVVGEVRRERGQVGGAEQAFVAAYSTLLSHREHNLQDVEVLKNLGSSAFWLGQSRLEQNDWKAALEWFTKYREYSDRRSEIEPSNVDGWIEQSYAHNSLGTLAQMRGDLATAEKEFLLSIGLKNKALARQPENRTLAAELADSLSWQGGTLEALGHLDEAMTAYRNETRILRTLRTDQPSELAWTYKLAEALHRTAVLQRAQGVDDLALNNLRESASLMTPIVRQEPGNRLWQKGLAFIDLDIGRITSLHSSNEGSLTAFETALARLDSITVAGSNNDEWIRTRELSRAQLARELLRNRRNRAATEQAEQAIANLQTMLAKNKSNRETREQLGQALLVLAEVNKTAGNSTAAVGNCRAAAEVIASLVSGTTDYKTLDPWVRANYCAGTPARAATQRAQLAQMRYHDTLYLASFTRNP